MLETVVQDLQRQLLKCQDTIRLQQKTIGAYDERLAAVEAGQAQLLVHLSGRADSRQVSSATFDGQGSRHFSMDSSTGDEPAPPSNGGRRHSSGELRLDSSRRQHAHGSGHRRNSSGGRGASGGRFSMDDDR